MMRMKVSDLKFWDRNPRFITQEDYQDLKADIVRKGFYQSLLIDQDNVVIGGNMRLRVLRELGIEEVWVSQVICEDEAERLDYAIEDNRRFGQNDEDKLAEIALPYADSLKGMKIDLGKSIPLAELLDRYRPSKEEEKPEVEFTEELMEAKNYIVLKFDNEIDWLQLLSLYPLKSVKALDSKEGFEKIGIGRVVNGVDFLNRILK